MNVLPVVGNDNLHEHLIAFADGELDTEQSLALWRFLSDHPDRSKALEWIEVQRKLTVVAQGHAKVDAPRDLRERIATLVNEHVESNSGARVARMPPPSRSSWANRLRIMTSIAAALAVGVAATFYTLQPARRANVLPSDTIVAVARIHGECSRLSEALHAASFESINASLAQTVKLDQGDPQSAPDLTAAGFRFAGAGPCPALGPRTVHLLYRSTHPESPAAASIFVQQDVGQFSQMQIGKVYRVSSPTAPFPTMAWRNGTVIYFLLTDDEQSEEKALRELHPGPYQAVSFPA